MYRSFTINPQFLTKKRRKLIYTPNNTLPQDTLTNWQGEKRKIQTSIEPHVTTKMGNPKKLLLNKTNEISTTHK